MREILIIADSLLAATILAIHFVNGGFDKNPIFLNALVVIAFATCVIRHINYYRQTKRFY
jgi:hypothetical protein